MNYEQYLEPGMTIIISTDEEKYLYLGEGCCLGFEGEYSKEFKGTHWKGLEYVSVREIHRVNVSCDGKGKSVELNFKTSKDTLLCSIKDLEVIQLLGELIKATKDMNESWVDVLKKAYKEKTK